MHKKEFYESGWFVDAFAQWKDAEIQVFGFRELKNNKWSAAKMNVNIAVSSGLDWFDTSLKVQFDGEEISLRQIQKAVKNASRYIPLGDGTMGLMPEEWMQKFANYFRTGDVVDGMIRTSKINFSLIDELYQDEVLDASVKEEITYLKDKINHI